MRALAATTPRSLDTRKEEPHQPPRVLLIEPELKLRAQLYYHFKKQCGYDVTVARQHDAAGYDIAGVTRAIPTRKAAFDLIILGEAGNPQSMTSVADKLRLSNRFNIPVLLLTDNEQKLRDYSLDAPRRSFSCTCALDRTGLLRDDKGRLTKASMDTVDNMAETLQNRAQQVKAQFPPDVR